MNTSRRFLGVALVLGAALLLCSSAFASLSGAIFTTDNTGTQVNGNIYSSKDAVYLDGGPQPNAPCTASGLPDGDYYFMVTNPNGSLLLSTDDISNRVVTVTGGLIVSTSGTHLIGGGKCPGAISVQLMPYSDTNNPGGEYKAWMTPVGSYSAANSGACPSNGYCWGFPNSSSKTDNFKAPPSVDCTVDPTLPQCQFSGTTVIVGAKFYDTNADTVWNLPDEPGVNGWLITISPPALATDLTTANVNCDLTGSNGQYGFTVPQAAGTTYTLSEATPDQGWFAGSGVNATGSWIKTSCYVPSDTGALNSQTNAIFCTPPTGYATDIAANPPGNPGPVFGNVCVGSGGGLTIGYWSNKNGQASMGCGGKTPSTCTTELAVLAALNLRDGKGKDFNPITYPAYATWLLSATATDMEYMLSAQLSATKLNVVNGFVTGSSLVYAPGANGSNAQGFISVQDLITEANQALGSCSNPGLPNTDVATCAVGAYSPLRSYFQALKNALDSANNNKNFVQAPGSCTATFTKAANTASCQYAQ